MVEPSRNGDVADRRANQRHDHVPTHSLRVAVAELGHGPDMIERTFLTQLVDKLVNAERSDELSAFQLGGPSTETAAEAARARRDLDDALDALHEQAWMYEELKS